MSAEETSGEKESYSMCTVQTEKCLLNVMVMLTTGLDTGEQIRVHTRNTQGTHKCVGKGIAWRGMCVQHRFASNY